MTVEIRRAAAADLDTLVAFNVAMAKESEDLGLDPATLRLGIEAVLNDPSRGLYFVAETGGQVAGTLMITYEWSDWRNANFWWIQSVYVQADWRRKGVYRALHDHVHSIAAPRDDICGIRLYVERTNDVAQRTYDSLGMSKSHYDMYEIDF